RAARRRGGLAGLCRTHRSPHRTGRGADPVREFAEPEGSAGDALKYFHCSEQRIGGGAITLRADEETRIPRPHVSLEGAEARGPQETLHGGADRVRCGGGYG